MHRLFKSDATDQNGVYSDFDDYQTHERRARRHRVANWPMNRMRPGSAGEAGRNHCPAPAPGNPVGGWRFLGNMSVMTYIDLHYESETQA